MKKFTKLFILAALAISTVACSDVVEDTIDDLTSDTTTPETTTPETTTPETTTPEVESTGKAKYIFYFIGDGMSATQLNLAEAAMNYSEFVSEAASQTRATTVGIGDLNMRTLPVTGMITTHAANRYITCSAAAATALATGEKTNIDFVSVSAEDGTTVLPTIAEKAKEAGMKVGIVSSVSIDHATPACFYAHTGYRDNYVTIGAQLIESGFDYFAGGSPRFNKHGAASNADARDAFVASAEAAGFDFVCTKSEFNALTSASTPVIATLNMLGEEVYSGDSFALPYSIDIDSFGEENDITLAQFTEKGAEVLMNDNGFFMMVESGKIDWACHANDAVTTAYEVVAFDEAIAKAIEFYNQYPDETLIVVTGDHDTGGLTLGFAGTSYENSFDLLMNQRASFSLFAAGYKTTFSYSTSASSYADVAEDADFITAFEQALSYASAQLGLINETTDEGDFSTSYAKAGTDANGFTIGSLLMMSDAGSFEVSDYEMALLAETFYQSVSGNKFNSFSSDDVYTYLMDFDGYDPFTTTCLTILCNKAGLEFSTYAHTAVPVPVFAMGAGADLFVGYYDNTDVPKKISEAAGLGL
ncbi:MAG: alkaline phosphatase [Rikenellaceae bacterium]